MKPTTMDSVVVPVRNQFQLPRSDGLFHHAPPCKQREPRLHVRRLRLESCGAHRAKSLRYFLLPPQCSRQSSETLFAASPAHPQTGSASRLPPPPQPQSPSGPRPLALSSVRLHETACGSTSRRVSRDGSCLTSQRAYRIILHRSPDGRGAAHKCYPDRNPQNHRQQNRLNHYG